MKNKAFSVRSLPRRYVVVDSRSGSVQVVHAHSQREANTKALVHFRTDGGIVTA